MNYEPQTENVKFRKSTKRRRSILKAQFFPSSANDSDVEDALISCWYDHNQLTPENE